MSDQPKSGDVLGIAPFGEAINTLAKGTVEGAGAFLSRICLPAAEEIGLLLRDKVTAWRGMNATRILIDAERLLSDQPDATRLHAPPRLVGKILDNGSWTDDDEVQKLWSGLLATACTEDGTDESNLIFVNLLNQLTSAQVRILRAACTQAPKGVSVSGWIFATKWECSTDELMEISGVKDSNRLDRELDHLSALGLLSEKSGFQVFSPIQVADVTPTSLGLHLYAKCNGHRGEPKDFYGLIQMTEAAPAQQRRR
jgi:hypothetical protein